MKNIIKDDLLLRVWHYAIGLIGLKKDDVWLASFPKAGSTWIRFILANIVYLSEEREEYLDYHYVAQAMPAIGRSNLLKSWRQKSLPRFIKTHQPYRPAIFSIPRRVVYIMRDPRDVMVSYYHFVKARKNNPFSGSFSEFIRHPRYGLASCIDHYFSWMPITDYTIHYEKMKKDAFAEMKNAFQVLNIEFKDDILRQAIENSSLERMRSAQKKSGLPGKERFDKSFLVARKGITGQWPDYFTQDDLTYYCEICTARQFDYHSCIEN